MKDKRLAYPSLANLLVYVVIYIICKGIPGYSYITFKNSDIGSANYWLENSTRKTAVDYQYAK